MFNRMRMGGVVARIPTSGLVCYLDAGDSSSYSGSGTTWANTVASPADGAAQSAYNFTLNSATFHGSAGSMGSAEYFTNGGTGYAAIGSNTTFINSMHKSGAAWTIASMMYQTIASEIVCGDAQFSNSQIGLYFASGNTDDVTVYNGSGSTTALTKSGTAGALNQWSLRALSIAEGATGFHFFNGVYAPVGGANTFSAGYTTPSSSAASQTFNIMAAGGGSALANTNTRYAIFAMWNRALSKAELDGFWAYLRGRYGV